MFLNKLKKLFFLVRRLSVTPLPSLVMSLLKDDLFKKMLVYYWMKSWTFESILMEKYQSIRKVELHFTLFISVNDL